MRSQIETVKVTPEMAAEWLRTSKINRKIKEKSVIEYSVAMEREEWHTDGPPITFLEDGSLSNGHHRLHAVVLYGRPVEFSVMRGVSRVTREVEDSGLNRSLADKITMFRPRTESVAARLGYLRLCVQLLSPEVRVRSLSDYDQWNGIFDKGIDWAVETFRSAHLKLKRSSVAGAMAFAHKTSPKFVEDFGRAVATGENLSAGDPAHALRKFLLADNTDKDTRSRVIIARKVFACVSAELGGQKITKIYDSPLALRDFTRIYDTPKVKNLIRPWSQEVALPTAPVVPLLRSAK